MTMYKLLHYDGVDKWGRHVIPIDFKGFNKFAAAVREYWSPEILDFIKKGSFPTDDDHLVTLTNVLSAGEVYGCNKNGDIFFKSALAHKGKDYGHKTFENGHCFMHHQNSDPVNSVGKIFYAHWNDRMARVETISVINREKAGKFAEQIDRGELPNVSMGCFISGHMIILEDGQMIPIEEIKENMRVRTHKGRGQKVTESYKRNYRGKLYCIVTPYNAEIRATEEHPFLVMHREDVMEKTPKGAWRRRAPEDIDFNKSKWICARHLQINDFLMTPINQEIETPDYATPELARLLGYYLAEGHTVYNKDRISGIQLSVNINDVIHEEIEYLCKKWGTRNKPVFRKSAHTDKAGHISIYDQELAKLCQEHCGRYSKNKKLSYFIQHWDHELQLNFLAAYLNGDGWQNDGRWQPGSAGISTSSETLANQIVQMLWRNNILSSVQTVKHKAGGGFNRTETTEFVIFIGKTQVDKLAEYSQIIKPMGSNRRPGGRRWLTEKYLLCPITGINSIEYVGEVFNFEVENDESYLVEGYAVHNCKVSHDICNACGNKAPNIKKYCDHLKYAMNKILPGGKKVYAINPYPRFFDQSYVLLGADRTASHLAKIAVNKSTIVTMPSAWLGLKRYGNETEKTASPKSADIIKEVPGQLSEEEETRLNDFAEKIVPRMEEVEPVLPKEAIDQLAKYEPEKVAASLLSVGVILRPSEWVSYCYQKAGRTKEAELLLHANDRKLIDLCPDANDITEIEFNIDFKDADPKIAEIVNDYLSGRSIFEPYFSERIAQTPYLPKTMKKVGILESLTELPEILAEATPDLIAALIAYLIYRTAVPKTKLRLIEQLFKARPEFLIPAVGGAAILRRQLFGKKEKPALPGQATYTIRTAADKKAVSPWIRYGLPFAVPYAISAHLRGQQRKGYRLGRAGQLMAENPFLSALVLGGGGIYGMHQLKDIGSKAIRAGLPKMSSAQLALIEKPDEFLRKRYPELAGPIERS